MAPVQQILQRSRFWLEQRPKFFLRLTVIAAVFLSSLYMAYRAARVPRLTQVFYNPLTVAIAGLIGAVFFLAQPEIGVLVMLPSLILLRMDMSTGSETLIGLPILMLLMLIGLWLFEMVARQRAIRLFNSITLKPLFAFLIASLIALGFGQLPWFDSFPHAPFRAQIGQVAIYLISFGAFLWMGHAIKNLNMLKKALAIACFPAVILVLAEYPGLIGHYTTPLVHFAAAGSMFWTWMIAMAFSQLVLNRQLSPAWRILLAGAIALALFFAIKLNLGWTSGWLPPLLAMAVIAWFGLPKLRKPMLLFGILVALLFTQKIYTSVMVGDNQYSLSTRLAAWQIIAKIVPANPLFGLGPANYYWFTPLFSIMGYRVVFNSHNNYVDLIAQLGLVGIGCFFWFAWSVLRAAWRLRGSVQDDFSRAYVYGVMGGWIASLVAAMLGDWVLPFVYNIGYAGLRASLMCWLCLGGLLFLERLHSNEELTETGGAEE